MKKTLLAAIAILITNGCSSYAPIAMVGKDREYVSKADTEMLCFWMDNMTGGYTMPVERQTTVYVADELRKREKEAGVQNICKKW